MCVCILALVVQVNRIFSAQHYVVVCDLAGATILIILSHLMCICCTVCVLLFLL